MILHCQKCSGILIKDFVARGEGSVSFRILCRCGEMSDVRVQMEPVVFVDGKRLREDGGSRPQIRTL